ncbi:MAG: hypothetical protein WD960_08995 [Gemmatimonadota bacterium]
MTIRCTKELRRLASVGIGAALLAAGATAAQAQDHGAHGARADDPAPAQNHPHWMFDLGGGWNLGAMGQLVPIAAGGLAPEGSPLRHTSVYLTQPVAMVNLESGEARFVLRFTPHFEGLTIAGGEKTFGGWGEGFIDSRHPHTYLHELMLSWNAWEAPGGRFSLSAGRGFAAYGTDDPMARPAVGYPTNHHLSQILERWTVNAVYVTEGGWGVEGSIFDGGEPESPGDVGNHGNFPNSWSVRLSRRMGPGDRAGPFATWEVAASFAEVRETHGGHTDLTRLMNGKVRYGADAPLGRLYGLVEASLSRPEESSGYFSVLGEGQIERGVHRPYVRLEYATRPEYEREGTEAPGFFRYDHDAPAIGATRWLIATLGYGHRLSGFPLAAKPFVEVGYHHASHERGPERLDPDQLFGASSFWGFRAGFRIFIGADGPMRMGSYGVLDPMSVMMRGSPHGAHEIHEMQADPAAGDPARAIDHRDQG